MSYKNHFLRRLVEFLRPKQPNSEEEKRFLILSTTGLGDTLWATPALRSLRESFPTSNIAVLTSPIGAQVLKNNRRVNALFILKNSSLFSLVRLYFQLKKQNITHVISFHTSQRLSLPLACILGAQEVIGSYGLNKGLDDLLTTAVDHKPVHEIQRRLDLVACMGTYMQNPSMEFSFSSETEKQVKEYLLKLNISSYLPLIALHPGSKDAFKRWPPSHFIELGRKLTSEIGCHLFITGSQDEKELAESIASHIPGAIALSSFSLSSLAALMKRLNLFITNDTGPMHLALSQTTPTLGIFTPTNPEACGPYLTPNSSVIFKETTCSPCLKKQCAEPFCLLQIGVDSVYEKALDLLYSRNSRPLVKQPLS